MFYDVKQEKSATILCEKNPVAQRKRVGENLRTHFWNRGGNSDQNVNVCLDKFKLRIFLHAPYKENEDDHRPQERRCNRFSLGNK